MLFRSIPFTSGILVGIGESEADRMASLEALAGFDHIQEVILQNFVPHRRYYGEEPAQIPRSHVHGDTRNYATTWQSKMLALHPNCCGVVVSR